MCQRCKKYSHSLILYCCLLLLFSFGGYGCCECRPELGKSLNTDEAIAMGAVYQGAGHTKLFRVKKFIVKEGTVYPIQVRERMGGLGRYSSSGNWLTS